MRKKREEVVGISYGEGKTPEPHNIPKVVPGLPQNPTNLVTCNIVIRIIRMLPPFIQTSKLPYTIVCPSITKVHLPFTKIILHPIQFHLPTRVLLPIVLTCSRATEHPLLYIKSKLHHIKIPTRTTKLQCQTTRQTHIPEIKLPVRIIEVINRCLPHKEVMIPLDLG